jgi:hypothetical protein
MEGYESDPIELCWQTIEEIRRRAAADGGFTTGRGGIVRSLVAFQHCHQRPTRGQLLNSFRGSQLNRSPPTGGRMDAGGAESHTDLDSHADHVQWVVTC